jgi:hypothetical protein
VSRGASKRWRRQILPEVTSATDNRRQTAREGEIGRKKKRGDAGRAPGYRLRRRSLPCGQRVREEGAMLARRL